MNTIRKSYTTIASVLVLLFSFQCQNNGNEKLSADAFEAKMEQSPNHQLIDVRTPGEFNQGHLQHAVNIDATGKDFESQLTALDKNKPVFIYCLSGGRSEKAGDILREHGFKEVYELSGGIMTWSAKKKPMEATVPPATGITLEEFTQKTSEAQLVLVDFQAKWCVPCKKMAPALEELAQAYSANFKLLKIDTDENPSIAQHFNITALPTLHLYKEGKQVWSKIGFTEKNEVEAQIKAGL